MLMLVALGVSLLLCELALRLVSPGYLPVSLDIYRLDDQDVLCLSPNLVRRHLTREWDVTVAINAQGLRDRSLPVSDAGGRVLALGDSFAFGWGVELPETFLFRTEEALRPESVRIVKAGVPGTGTSDQLLWLRRHGESIRPDLVIVSFFVGNDFVDVQMGGVTNQFSLRDGFMVRKTLDDRPPSWWTAMAQRVQRQSLLAQKVAGILWLRERRADPRERKNPGLTAADRWLWEYYKIHLNPLPPETRRACDSTLAALDGIRLWCEQHHAGLMLLVIPRSFQVYDWELARWNEAFRIPPAQLDLNQPQTLLAEWAARNQVPDCDLLPAFRQYAGTHPNDRLFYFPDAHMNAAGHRQTGDLLADFIREKQLAKVRR